MLIPLKDQDLTDAVLRKAERSRTVGLENPVVAFRFQVFAVHYEGGGVGELGQKVGLGGVDGDFNRAGVDDPDARYLVRLALQLGKHTDDVVQVRVSLRRLRLGVRGALDGELHVVRGDGLAVMELGVRAQVEGVGLSVLAHVPALRQIRHHL